MPSPSPPWVGLAIVIASALLFSIAVTAVPRIYADGGNPYGLLVVRNLGFAAILALVLSIFGHGVRLAPKERHGSFLIGLVFAGQSWCFYHSIALLSVGLSTLIVFIYPLIVALVMRTRHGEALGWGKIAALLTALIGLALALDVRASALDWRGVALAFLAAFGSTAMAVVGARVLGNADSWRMTMYMCLATGVALLAIALMGEGLTFPKSEKGLFALGIAMLFYTIAITGYFRGLQMIGPSRTAMASNVEPIGTLLLAAIVWGDPLGPWQILGASLVVGAILVTQRAAVRA
jgi:drug/metabolite transporter (DMT)-like permease